MRKRAGLLIVAGLTGCAMAESTLVGERSGLGCSSDAGAYSLSKTFVVVEIIQKAGLDFGESYALKSVNLERRADKSRQYCLDYLGSPTADETFAVEKNDSGLLTKVTANSKDQSATIAKKFAETVFTLVSGNAEFDANAAVAGRSVFDDFEAKLSTAYRAEFDPFNRAQAAIVNDSMREFGFCILVEEQGLSPGQTDADSYCERPLGGITLETALENGYAAEDEQPPIRDVRGILYRPRVPYVMYLFIKRDLNAPGGWMLKASEAVHLENRSPVLGIGIDRAFFTQRRTALTFDEGALLDIDIDKKSELAGFVEVPLYIAQGIAALPTNIIQVKINETNNNAQLINAQQQLIDAETQHRKTLTELAALRGGGVPGPSTPQTSESNVQNDGAAESTTGGRATGETSTSAATQKHVQCVERNTPAWGKEEAEHHCCAIIDCAAAGLSGPACDTFCSPGG